MKIYSIDVVVYATAYIRAASEEEAQEIAEGLNDYVLELPEGQYGGVCISGANYDNDDLPDVSLSPSMTIGLPDVGSIEQVED